MKKCSKRSYNKENQFEKIKKILLEIIKYVLQTKFQICNKFNNQKLKVGRQFKKKKTLENN